MDVCAARFAFVDNTATAPSLVDTRHVDTTTRSLDSLSSFGLLFLITQRIALFHRDAHPTLAVAVIHQLALKHSTGFRKMHMEGTWKVLKRIVAVCVIG